MKHLVSLLFWFDWKKYQVLAKFLEFLELGDQQMYMIFLLNSSISPLQALVTILQEEISSMVPWD